MRFPFSNSVEGRRSRHPAVVVFLLVLAGALYAARHWSNQTAPDSSASRVLCPVVGVTDGDTLRVEYHGRLERIRMLRINTPERGQPGARQATDQLRNWVQAKTVALEFEEPEREDRDAYGRLLAYVFVGETNVNLEQVRQGWSHFYVTHGEGRYAGAFREAEKEARAAKRGIWVLDAQ